MKIAKDILNRKILAAGAPAAGAPSIGILICSFYPPYYAFYKRKRENSNRIHIATYIVIDKLLTIAVICIYCTSYLSGKIGICNRSSFKYTPRLMLVKQEGHDDIL